MIEYKYRGRLMRAVAGLGIGGGVLCLVAGCLTASVWLRILSGNLYWSAGEFLLINLGMVVPLGIVIRGAIQCTAILVQKDGLRIQTCYFFSFFVPWQNLTDLRSYSSFSPTALRIVQTTFVSVTQGLTPLHRGVFFRGLAGALWPRGFTITSEAQGYSALVQAIEEHIRNKQ
jgi:hypothetical protein